MPKDKIEPIGKEFDQILMEATQSVEDALKLEDTGWINFSAGTGDVISAADKITNMKLSRLYAVKDPLGKQSIRLWTDYTFGTGMTWQTEDDMAKKALDSFWDARCNRKILGAAGQRKSSNNLLRDGVIYFAIFLGPDQSNIRRIDPLEITEIITDPDDKEDEKYYRRQWADRQGTPHTTIYRSITNIKGVATLDMNGNSVTHNDDALVYRMEYNDGNPLLLPALDWIKQYRRFLASRIAIVLALARFAWHIEVSGGQAAVEVIKAKLHGEEVAAGSTSVTNKGASMVPIKTDSGARNAYDDGRMIKLQIAAAVGIPEQYFGDISIGNQATAKTVELPMLKMFQSYQKVWSDAYQDIDEVILEHAGVSPEKWYVDMEFPAIAPEDVAAAATAIVQILQAMPDLAYSEDVKQIALMTLGVNDPKEALEALGKVAESDVRVKLSKVLKEFRESLIKEK